MAQSLVSAKKPRFPGSVLGEREQRKTPGEHSTGMDERKAGCENASWREKGNQTTGAQQDGFQRTRALSRFAGVVLGL